ncbi:hypothetical protein Vlu01_48140 [Micromonospora lutea]|uniref:HTTM-like domain-containing protein n=1 Tax=Micromonospora lutea TaxID=419825 RepID=A0ABQ4J224_9ACTN|nr:hypothetical protein Vlu01_48140 [Micromonospora lutea]
MLTAGWPVPWGPWLGVARSLLALGTAGTLAFTSAGALFIPVPDRPESPYCDAASGLGVFCLVDKPYLDLVRWACVAVLLLVASGWQPRWTAIPHWWISFSVASSISVPDGGDHVTQVLVLLLVPVCLTDPRRWHWSPTPAPDIAAAATRVAVAVCLLVAIRIQVAGIYFQSSVAKLSHAEWADGTALYYWLNHRTFGAPGWLQPVTDWMTDVPLLLAGLTWSPLVIEFALAIAVLLPARVRLRLLPAGIVLHLGIAVTMGLWSFALAMFAAVVLLTIPFGAAWSAPADEFRAVADRLRPRRQEPQPTQQSKPVPEPSVPESTPAAEPGLVPEPQPALKSQTA